MRRFVLDRRVDVSGISGTGYVAEGVVFSDGSVAMRWCTGNDSSVNFYPSISAVRRIHGHGTKTKVIWHDHPKR